MFNISLSSAIVAETEGVLLERPHIRRRYRYTDKDVKEFCQSLQRSFVVVTDLPRLTDIVRDPQDDVIVACAVKARASHIVTRDDDLLSLRQYEGISIVTPEVFIALLREQGLIE